MNRITIRNSISLIPFRPFIVHLSDGQKFEVKDPSIIAVSPEQEIAIIFTDFNYHIIDTTKITSLENI